MEQFLNLFLLSYLFLWHVIAGNSTDSSRISLSVASEVVSNSAVGEMVRSISCSSGVGIVTGVLWFADVVGIMVRSIRELLDVELVKESTGEFSPPASKEKLALLAHVYTVKTTAAKKTKMIINLLYLLLH